MEAGSGGDGVMVYQVQHSTEPELRTKIEYSPLRTQSFLDQGYSLITDSHPATVDLEKIVTPVISQVLVFPLLRGVLSNPTLC